MHAALLKKLAEIPLEYFLAALDRLKAEPRVNSARIDILGISKGAEASLFIASRDPAVKADGRGGTKQRRMGKPRLSQQDATAVLVAERRGCALRAL